MNRKYKFMVVSAAQPGAMDSRVIVLKLVPVRFKEDYYSSKVRCKSIGIVYLGKNLWAIDLPATNL